MVTPVGSVSGKEQGWVSDLSRLRNELKRKKYRRALCHFHMACRSNLASHQIITALQKSVRDGEHVTWGLLGSLRKIVVAPPLEKGHVRISIKEKSPRNLEETNKQTESSISK